MPSYTNYRSSRPGTRSFGGSRNANRYGGRSSGGGRRRSSPVVDINRYIKQATVSEEVVYAPTNKFSDFDVVSLIHDNLTAKGFVIPSPIQDQTIPIVLEGRDVIGIASTGTGKTAAFGVPVLHKLITDKSSKVLVIAPTRELADQIENEFRSLAKGSGLYSALLIGGSNMGKQIRDLKANPRIVIGTPGRIEDHIDRRTLDLSKFNIIVLDEVDRMLDMGFIGPVRSILSNAATERQSLFFSATMDSKVQTLINTFGNSPTTISLKTNDASSNVNQDIVRYISKSEKILKLHELLQKSEVEKAIVFDSTKHGVERLSKDLAERGFRTDSIHGGKSQSQRQRALARFKSSNIDVLVATDVAARGIDVPDISHVINYSIPETHDDYIHRVGRAGRAGRIGHAYTFVS